VIAPTPVFYKSQQGQKTMSHNLFDRINNETTIQIVWQDKPYKPGYRWQWQGKHGENTYGSGTFKSQEAALISAINSLSESHGVTVTNCLELMEVNEKLKSNKKTNFLEEWWLNEKDKEMWVLLAILVGFTMFGTFGVIFFDLFLNSRCVPTL
jgi:hypothetical protein